MERGTEKSTKKHFTAWENLLDILDLYMSGQVVFVHVMKVYEGSRCIAPLILTYGSR
jgi:hypothetical protein